MEALKPRSVLSGAFFGAALTASGVWSPTVIVQQLHFEDFHMLKVFLSASASSAIVILLANRLNFSAAKPTIPKSLNLFSKYDGNIIGGVLLGSGMALTGACPGTVLPQIATGIPSAPLVLLGGILGGIIYSKYGKQLTRPTPFPVKGETKQSEERPTIDQTLSIDPIRALAIYEALCLGIVASVSFLAPDTKEILVPGAVGGLFVGGSQFTSLWLTGNTLGVSTAYEQLGDLFWWILRLVTKGRRTERPTIKSLAFVLGSILGSFAVRKALGINGAGHKGGEVVIGSLRAVVGGVLLTIGSRIAGGCTSGHGISGMSLLSVSSFISVGAMFAGGMGLAAVLKLAGSQ